MNPWIILLDVLGWGMLALVAFIVIGVPVTMYRTARTKRMIKADRRTTVFAGKRKD